MGALQNTCQILEYLFSSFLQLWIVLKTKWNRNLRNSFELICILRILKSHFERVVCSKDLNPLFFQEKVYSNVLPIECCLRWFDHSCCVLQIHLEPFFRLCQHLRCCFENQEKCKLNTKCKAPIRFDVKAIQNDKGYRQPIKACFVLKANYSI